MSTLPLVIGAATWNAHPNSSLNCKLLSPIFKTPRIFQDTGFWHPLQSVAHVPESPKALTVADTLGPPPTVRQTFWPSVGHCSGAVLFQCRVVEPQMTVLRLLLQAHWTLTHPLTLMQTSLIYAKDNHNHPKRLKIHAPHPVLGTNQSHR